MRNFEKFSLVVTMFFVFCVSVGHGELVAHWSFDDSGDRFADSSGNGRDLTGSGTIDYTPGISGSAMHLTGAGKAYFDFGSDVNMDELTVVFRVYQPSGASAWKDYVELGYHTDFGAGYCYVLERSNLDRVVGYNCHAFVGANSPVNGGVDLTDAWHSVAFRASKSENRACFYIDGVQQSSLGWSCVSNLNNVTVGGAYALSRYITADIDDVQIYDNALTPSEIVWLDANPGADITQRGQGPLLAHWTFDDSSDRYADSSENLQSLTQVGAVSFVPGKSGDAMHLVETGGASTDFGEFKSMEEFSVSFWANTADDARLWRDYFEIGMPVTNTDSSVHAFVFELSGTDRVTTYNSYLSYVPQVNVTYDIRGAWHHFAVTASRNSGYLKVYVDGVLRGSGTGWAVRSPFERLTVGTGSTRTGREIKADIDDMQIYNYAINDSDVSRLFHRPGKTLFDPPEGTVILVY